MTLWITASLIKMLRRVSQCNTASSVWIKIIISDILWEICEIQIIYRNRSGLCQWASLAMRNICLHIGRHRQSFSALSNLQIIISVSGLEYCLEIWSANWLVSALPRSLRIANVTMWSNGIGVYYNIPFACSPYFKTTQWGARNQTTVFFLNTNFFPSKIAITSKPRMILDLPNKI